MTREDFKNKLAEKDYAWRVEGNSLIVRGFGEIDLSIESLPPEVEFMNTSYVYLDSLEILPSNVKFKNGGSVSLHSLKSIPRGTIFENGRGIWLDSFGIDTSNSEDENNILNIEGISPKRILNQMISVGLLDRK